VIDSQVSIRYNYLTPFRSGVVFFVLFSTGMVMFKKFYAIALILVISASCVTAPNSTLVATPTLPPTTSTQTSTIAATLTPTRTRTPVPSSTPTQPPKPQLTGGLLLYTE
jgi:hypothetical protein